MSTSRPSTWRSRSSALALAVAVLASSAGPAAASRWPLAGGDPGRSGDQPIAPGTLPAPVAWSADSVAVRTPVLITGGIGPTVQRVAYGTADGRVHLRALASGAEIGPPGGTLVADGAVTTPGAALGAGFADTSSDTRPGVLFVVHNDGGGVEIARFDVASGARLGTTDIAVPDSLGCTADASTLLTPPTADGSRLLLFTLRGRCTAAASLVRVPIGPDAAGRIGTLTFATVPGLAEAAPALVILGGPGGAPRFFVAVGREGAVDFFDSGRAFSTAPSARATPVDLSAALPGETPSAISGAASGVYVTAAGGPDTRVHRVVQDASGLRAVQTVELPGAPVAGGLAVGGTGTVVVTSSGLAVLRSADLTPVGGLVGTFGAPAVSGDYAYVAGGPSVPTAIRLSDGTAVSLGAFVDAAGTAPALARGMLAVGSDAHVAAYRTTDVTAPAVTLAAGGLQAQAADDRGVASVTFFLAGHALAPVTAAASGSSLAPGGAAFAAPLTRSALPPGRAIFGVVARDAAGNAGSARREVRGPGCAKRRRGGRRADRLSGGRGRDCLDGRGGNDRLDGRGGADQLAGGSGRDLLRARDGAFDALRCGSGRDTVIADRQDFVAADCERVRLPGT